MTTTDTLPVVAGPPGPDVVSIVSVIVANAYPNDELTAGLVVAWLPTRDQFYIALVRYPTKDRRVTVGRGQASTLLGAIVDAVEVWLPVAPISKEYRADLTHMIAAAREA